MNAKKTSPRVNLSGPSMVLTRILNAPRALVFAAWSEPEHIKQWSAPHGFTIPVAEGDFRVGGTWRTCMVKPDGEKMWLHGVYREIRPVELLSFTHIWEEDDGTPENETLITVQLEDLGGKTKLTLTQQFFASVESRDGHEGGWTQCFEKLEAHLATLQK
jgi:uncharacterized protein YndB with AHSA1/START domain